MVISNLIINIILFDGGIATNEANNRELLTTMAIYAIPSMVIFAPICEELIFKKSFTKTFSNKYQFTIFTGVLFGSAHLISGGLTLQNLLYIIPYSSLGIVFSYMYIKSNNIFPPSNAGIGNKFVIPKDIDINASKYIKSTKPVVCDTILDIPIGPVI